MKYRTVVADPPWDHSDGTGRNYGERDFRGTGKGPDHHTTVPYPVMDLAAIESLPISAMTERNAHLYLWTTNRFLHAAYHVAEAWGFRVSKPLVWCKEPMGFFGKPFISSAEFVLYCRRGSLRCHGHVERQWWIWPRGAHSAKPEAFLDIVESVSPGPYLELFARRNRLGWDTWGNEALNHIDLGGTA